MPGGLRSSREGPWAAVKSLAWGDVAGAGRPGGRRVGPGPGELWLCRSDGRGRLWVLSREGSPWLLCGQREGETRQQEARERMLA